MLSKDTVAVVLGMGAIVVTLGVGTCSTNRRIDDSHRRMDDGFENLQRQIGAVHRRMDDGFGNLQRQVDNLQTDVRELQTDVRELQTDVRELQTDVRELRSLDFEMANDEPPAD